MGNGTAGEPKANEPSKGKRKFMALELPAHAIRALKRIAAKRTRIVGQKVYVNQIVRELVMKLIYEEAGRTGGKL